MSHSFPQYGCEILKPSTSAIALVLGAPRCWGSIMTITTAARGSQSYKMGVFKQGENASRQTQCGAGTRRRLSAGIRSVVLCLSDESSGLLRHSPGCHSGLSLPLKCSTFPSTHALRRSELSLPLCIKGKFVYQCTLYKSRPPIYRVYSIILILSNLFCKARDILRHNMSHCLNHGSAAQQSYCAKQAL